MVRMFQRDELLLPLIGRNISSENVRHECGDDRMQARYAGDVGDFVRLGLLRALSLW